MISLIFLFLSSFSYAVDIGSDTSVTRFASDQVLFAGDRIAGFAAIEGGFTLAGVTTTATFDSFFPVTGPTSFSGGTLILNRDLRFYDASTLTQFGNIVGQFHTLEFAATMTSLPIRLDQKCEIAPLAFTITADAVNSLDWDFSSQFIALGLGPAGDEVAVYKLVGASVSLADSLPVAGTVFSVDWNPNKHIIAAGRIAGTGDELRLFEFDVGSETLTELVASSVAIGGDVNAVAWHPTGRFLAIGTTDNSPEVSVFGFDQTTSTLNTTALTTINFSPNIDVNALDWDATGSYLAIGTQDNAADELFVYAFDEVSLTLNVSLDVGRAVLSVDWSPTLTDVLAVGLALPTGVDLLRIFEHDAGAGTLTLKNSENFVEASVISVGWSPDGECLGTGYSLNTGAEFIGTEFDSETFGLTPNSFLNLTGAAIGFLAPNNVFAAIGTSASQLIIGINIAVSSTLFTLSNIKLLLSCDSVLKGRLLFSGLNVLNGNGYKLDLAETSSLVVNSGASLLIKDITLENVDSIHLKLLDSTSTISFDNVRLILDKDFLLDNGSLDIIRDCRVEGDGFSFIYNSDQASTIGIDGALIFDEGVTFSYDPPIANQDLLIFATSASVLNLNNATMHVTTTGLRLKKGRLIIDGVSVISSDATVDSEAVSFGDGINSANNLDVHIRPAATLEVTQGIVINNDV